jgi:hypothetical protein
VRAPPREFLAAANKADDDGQIIPELAASYYRPSRRIGFEIGKELTRCGVALGINADEYR